MKEWYEMNAEEREKALNELILFDAVLARYDAKPHDIYRWMMVTKMPSWLVEGELRFHPVQLDEWEKQIGGIAALKAREADERKRDGERDAKERAEAEARQQERKRAPQGEAETV